MSTPTMNGDAPIDSASSATTTRLPLKTEWLAIPIRIRVVSVREAARMTATIRAARAVRRAGTSAREPLVVFGADPTQRAIRLHAVQRIGERLHDLSVYLRV